MIWLFASGNPGARSRLGARGRGVVGGFPSGSTHSGGAHSKPLSARPSRLLSLGALLAGLARAGPAHAHSLSNRVGDFYGGMLHPLSALEHVLPFLALGLLAGQQGARAARWLVLVFPLGLLLGTAFAAVTAAGYRVTPVNHLTFVVLGLLLVAAWRIPLALLLALGALIGFSYGYENGRDIAGAALHLFVPGVALVGFITTALASAATLALTARADWPRVAVRIAGSWIAAIGIMMIGLA